jgi:glucosamine-6-phosphate deaminase
VDVKLLQSEEEVGRAAGAHAVEILQDAIAADGQASIVVGTGASQFAILKNLTASKEVAWDKVNLFHLDEYVGLTPDHPASFRRFLKEYFIDRVGRLKSINNVLGDAPDLLAECRRLAEIIARLEITLSLIGIGENGHLAFNDPPADFETEHPFIVVTLDEACRMQQVGEGWYGSLAEVPAQAITMTVPQIMKSKHLIACVLDERKAAAAHKAIDGELTNQVPASILRQHANCTLYFDFAAASLLTAAKG